jgi:CubicO group peptidase (beta-lactamase class C family)
MKPFAGSISFAAGLFAASFAFAQSLPSAKPADVGFSAERLDRITQVLRADAAKGMIPGAALLIARDGKIAYHETFGVIDPETKAPMPKDAIYRIYSMTKPIASVAAMILAEEGKIALSDPVAKYISAFRDVKVGVEKPGADGKPALELTNPRRAMTVQDLLRHTSGLTYGIFGSNLVKKAYLEAGIHKGDWTNAEFAERLAKLPLVASPGAVWDYSHSTDVLGRIVEVASGKTLYAFMKERILDPVGMPDTAFSVSDPAKHARVVEPFKDDRTIGTDAVFFDPRQPQIWEGGGGSMVGSTMDYARFAQMLLNGGAIDGKRILGPKTVAFMTSDHVGAIPQGNLYLPGEGYGFGLGFAVRKDDGIAQLPGSVGDYAWGGAGGTYFWIDPKERMLVVFMMQSPRQRVHYRAVLKNMIYAAIETNGRAVGQ